MKQVDTQDLKSCGFGREGSIPSPDTNTIVLWNKGENHMDLISFILGMSIVVVIAVAVVAVIAFVRVNKQKEEIKQIEQFLAREIENQMRDRDRIVDDIYRTIDSRLDKLESRLNAARHKD